MGKLIAVTSGKGGTGKTTCAAAIASCLAFLGHRTVCIDGDMGLKNLDLTLGVAESAVKDFTDVLYRRASLTEAAFAHPAVPDLFVLTSPVSLSPEEIRTEDMDSLRGMLRTCFDYAVIDAPAGVGPGFRLCAEKADMAIVVCTGEAASLRDGERTAAELYAMGIGEVRLLVNRLTKRNLRHMDATLDDYTDRVGARLLGIVSEDRMVPEAVIREKPLILCNSKASFQFLRIARRIDGQDVPVQKL